MKRNVYKIIFVIACGILLQCANTPNTVITYEIENSDYDVKVVAEGVLEATNSKKIITPVFWGQPTIAYLIDEGTTVKKGELVLKFEVTELQNDFITLTEQYESAQAAILQRESELGLEMLLNQAQMRTATASAKAAKIQYEKLQFEAERIRKIKALEIQQFELDAQSAKDKVQSLKAIQQAERESALAELKQMENRISRIREQLAQQDVYAPQNGLVLYEESWITDAKFKEGDAVWRGMPVLNIPDLTQMQVRIFVSETDAQRLRVDQAVTISLPTESHAEYSAHVIHVERIAKRISRNSQVKKVEVMVQLDSTNLDLVPGTTAICSILVKSITGMPAIPLEAIFEEDSSKVVFIKDENLFRAESIAILTQDDDFTVVYGNVEVGDKVALVRPTESLVQWPKMLTRMTAPAWADTLKLKPVKTEMTQTVPVPADFPPMGRPVSIN